MSGFEHIGDEEIERLKSLAETTRITLLKAGIPAFNCENPNERGGAEIEVDTGDDEAGGVFITWTLSVGLTDEVSSHLINGNLDHPIINFSGKIKTAMIDAIITVLNAAGIPAGINPDDMRPLSIILLVA